jgi:hypothetical protein
MARHSATLVLLLGATISAWQTPATLAPARIATGSVDLTDPAGDVQPIVYLQSVGNGPTTEAKYPAFDVTKLSIASDGKTLSFAATLAAPPAQAASDVIEFYIDADNNLKTGVTIPFEPRQLSGLEFYGALKVCLERDLFGTTCTGADKQPLGHSAIATIEKYGKEWMFKDTLVGWPAAGTVKKPVVSPIKGAVIQAGADYGVLGVKSGQTIRLVVREACAGKVNNVTQGYFPEIVLTLK